MAAKILQNLLLLGALAALALAIVWGFFRIFAPGRPDQPPPKWRLPAAAAGFFAIYTALIGIYVPLINRQAGEILVQETRYGPVELDVNKLFEVGDSNNRIGIPKGYYVAADSSFYLMAPDPTFWRTETDSIPSFLQAVALQRNNFDIQFGDFASSILGMPSIEDTRVGRYCAAEVAKRQLVYTADSRMDSLPVTFDPLRQPEYWHAALKRMYAALRDRLPDSLRAEADPEQITDADINQVMEQWTSTFGSKTPPMPRQYPFRNSICVLSFPPVALEPELAKTLHLPQRQMHLMRFGRLLTDIVPSFSLGSLRDVATSRDGRAMLARDPLELQSVTLDGKAYERLAVEQIYLLGVAPKRAYFVQVQFMVAPGQDMSSWRQIQQSVRSLRFVVHE